MSKVETFEARSPMPGSAAEVFAWHAREGAFERLAPPWERVRILGREGTIHDGDRLRFQTGGFRWEAVHGGFVEGRQFQDRQERGPFHSWLHTHRFEAEGAGASILDDHIDYALPLGALGRAVAGGSVRRRLERTFRYRHRVLAADLARHQRFADRPRLRVAISGASGLIGSALAAFLSTGGHHVLRLVRREPGENEIRWDPERGTIDRARLEGLDAVIHLAGENVGGGRWTDARKQRILGSRVDGTRLLAETLASLAKPPRVLVSASAIGVYGPLGSAGVPCDEDSPAADDFLARVCVEWEAAAAPALARGIRVVHPRFGVVLSPRGGALAKLLGPFSFGVGGRIGSGRQRMSWVAIDDAVAAVYQLLYDEQLSGPVNVVAPWPVSNAQLAAALGRVLHRPAALPLPAFVVRLLFGEMGETVLLGGAEVAPRRLLDRGFTFDLPDLDGALAYLLGREARSPRLSSGEVAFKGT